MKENPLPLPNALAVAIQYPGFESHGEYRYGGIQRESIPFGRPVAVVVREESYHEAKGDQATSEREEFGDPLDCNFENLITIHGLGMIAS